MKNLLKTSVAALMMATACSPVYYRQVATLSSDDVKFNERGEFVYENDMVCIEYNFWRENGGVDFLVTNNTDDDIYLDLSQSFFIRNGYAYDYFKNRSWQASNGLVLSSSQGSASSGVTTHAVASGYGNTRGYIYGDYFTSSTSAMALYDSRTVVSSRNSAFQVTSQNGYSVEYQEIPVVCIPAHSSKRFGEYIVSASAYRECEFNRKPKSREESVREFSKETSPLVIENRLMFIFGDVHIPVINMFYASRFQNIAVDDEEQNETIKHCNGSTEYVCIHKLHGVNKYYINYSESDIYSPSGPVMEKKRNDSPEIGNTWFSESSDAIYNPAGSTYQQRQEARKAMNWQRGR